MNAQVWVQALTLGACLAAAGWLVAAGPLRIFARASRNFWVFNALAALATLAWWPLPALALLPPAYRLSLGLVALLAGIQWLCLGLHKLYDFKPTYVVSPLMLPFLALWVAAVAWVDDSGQGSLMAACGASLWVLGVTVQQGFVAIAASAGNRVARWVLSPVLLAGCVWIVGMAWAGARLVLGAPAADSVARMLGEPLALVWLVSWGLLNATLVGLVILKLIDKIRDLTVEDDLTGAMNERSFMALLNAERERIRRHPEVQTVVVCEIDQLQALNRQLGFAAGDAALRHVTSVMGRKLRKTDRLGATVQSQLLLFLPATPIDGGLLVAERMQAALKDDPLLWRGQAINLTLSMGLASWDNGELTADALIDSAAEAAARAKREGGARSRLGAGALAVASASQPVPAASAN